MEAKYKKKEKVELSDFIREVTPVRARNSTLHPAVFRQEDSKRIFLSFGWPPSCRNASEVPY